MRIASENSVRRKVNPHAHFRMVPSGQPANRLPQDPDDLLGKDPTYSSTLLWLVGLVGLSVAVWFLGDWITSETGQRIELGNTGVAIFPWVVVVPLWLMYLGHAVTVVRKRQLNAPIRAAYQAGQLYMNPMHGTITAVDIFHDPESGAKRAYITCQYGDRAVVMFRQTQSWEIPQVGDRASVFELAGATFVQSSPEPAASF